MTDTAAAPRGTVVATGTHVRHPTLQFRLCIAVMELTALLAVALCAVVALVMWNHWRIAIRAPRKGLRVPGPPQVPLLGNLPLLVKHKDTSMELFIDLQRQYGDIYALCALQFGT